MTDKTITLAGKEFNVSEMPIGKRKFLVPAIRDLGKDLQSNPSLNEKQYDILIEIIFRALFPTVKKDDILGMVLTEGDLFTALTVVAQQCGLKSEDKKTGEDQGENANSPITTP